MKKLLTIALLFSIAVASENKPNTTPVNIGIKFDMNSDLIKILKSFSTNAPEGSKALTTFTQEVTTSAKKLLTYFMTTIQSVDSDMTSLGAECMSSGQEIVNGLKDVIETLTRTPEEPLREEDKAHLKSTVQHILNHATLITTKTATHLGKNTRHPTIAKETGQIVATK